jgi:hypothetical protein
MMVEPSRSGRSVKAMGSTPLIADLERAPYITDSFLLMKPGDATCVPDFGKNPEFGQMKNDVVRITGKIQARIESLGQLNMELKETFGI